MPFNAETYKLHANTHLNDLLESCFDDGPSFVKQVSKKEASSLYFKLNQYKKAHYVQSIDDTDSYEKHKFDYIQVKVKELGKIWGVLIEEVSPPTFDVINPITGESKHG